MAFASDSARKRNAAFWFVSFLVIAILVFWFTSGWWTILGYLAAFMSFGALLEIFRKPKN